MDKEILFYDIEVFAHDAIVVFKNIHKETIDVFHNKFEKVLPLIKGKRLVGYNNYFYDDFILTQMMEGKSIAVIKNVNDNIISGGRKYHVHREIDSIDCFQQIDVGYPSLKKIEGNFGKSIIESGVPFDIERPLTDQELTDTIRYCSYDVDNTIDIYKMREKSYFTPKESIVQMLPKELLEKNASKVKRWNTTTISANILTNKPMEKWSDIRLGKYNSEGIYDLLSIVPKEVKQHWKTQEKGNITIREFGCNLEFGFGGLHGVPTGKQREFYNVILLDVASLYPNIIMKINALGGSTELYKSIVTRRLSVKHTDKVLSGALKLVINSVYGLLKNQYSLLYNPKAAKSVCLYGQAILYDLCKRLSPTCRLVNINTDGVAFTTNSEDYKTVWKEWESDYGFTLEADYFDRFIQKDVNNYVGIKGDYIKCKGGDVGRYKEDSWFKNNSNRIVDIAIVDKLVYGKDVLDSIIDNLYNPRLFQMILQAGNTYEGTFDQDGNQYNKVNRVFATKKDGVLLFKQKADGSTARFPDAPESMFVWNDDIDKLENFEQILNIDFYYQLINKTLERWE